MVKVARFALPIIFAGAGWVFAFFLVREIAGEFGDLVTYNMTDLLPGNIAQEITLLLGIIPLAGIIVYIFLGVFIASVLMFAAKIARSTAYDLDIVQTGRNFGGLRMIRRAAVPAVFAVAFSGLISGTITNLLFSALENIPVPAQLLWQALFPIMGVLVTLPIVLAIFMPTWILNDAGIVMHLKANQLDVRRCPDTIGVGRWWSNLLAGFTLFAIPIVSFIQHFLPLIVSGETAIIPYFWSFVITLGIPFLAMTFVMPVVVFNEIFISLTKRATRRVARALGAREIKMETVITEAKIDDEGPMYGWSLKEREG